MSNKYLLCAGLAIVLGASISANVLIPTFYNYAVEITKGDDLKGCIADSILNINRMIGKKSKNIKKVYVDVKSYYFDSKKCSGVCLYYVTVTHNDKMLLDPKFMNGKPYNVFVLSNGKISYFTDNMKQNKNELDKLNSILKDMPDSVKNDSNLIRNYVLQ